MDFRSATIKYLDYLEHQGKAFNIVAGLYCTALLGFLDFYTDTITGLDYTLAFFYLLPVAFVAWFSGMNAAYAGNTLVTIDKAA